MSWVTLLFSMAAALCFTLAGVYFLVWLKQRQGWEPLLFSFSAASAGVIAELELAALRAETGTQYGELIRWAHLPLWVLMVSAVWFVHLYLRAGRRWLVWTVCGVRSLALILNFLSPTNLNFSEVTSLRHFSWWGGEHVVAPIGVPNPWTVVGQAGALFLLIFLVDVTITVWRRGDRRRAILVSGSAVFFITLSLSASVLVGWGVIHAPFFISFAYMGIIAAMGYELSDDLLRAAHLARRIQASEAELRESEARMNLAANAAKLGLWELNTTTNELWLSDSERALFQFEQDGDVTYKMFQDRIHPEDRLRCDAAVRNAIRTRTGYEIEYRALLPDKSMRWIGGRARLVSDPGGKVPRLLGVSMDITERKEAEELFRVAIEASPAGILLVNDRRQIVLINAHIEELFGYQRDELLGKPVEVLLPELLAGEHLEDRSGSLSPPETRPIGAGHESVARRKDGSEFPVELGLSSIHGPDGLLVLAAVVDISQRKQAEEEARSRRQQLELLSRVSLLGEMTASIAHELNQPLAAIVSNASAGQRFIDQGKIETLREILVDVAADGRRAHDVIQNIRDTIKKGTVTRHRIDLNHVVTKATHFIEPNATVGACEIQTFLDPGLPEIEGDPIQLEQVLINLVTNACEAMAEVPAARRKVEITTEQKDNETVHVSVRDFGTGISNEARSRLFEQFFTTKHEGLGMGLAIVRSIVEAHGGQITAGNVNGGGARFDFSLPIASGQRGDGDKPNGFS